MTKRRYSDEERAACLAALAANGGDVSKTAQQVGVPRETLRCWANGTRHPEVMQTHQEKKPQLADRLEELAYRLADAALEPERLTTAPLQQVVTSLGIAVDKMRLLRSESTEISEQRDDDRLAEFRKRYPPSDAAPPAGADRRAQPADTAPAQR